MSDAQYVALGELMVRRNGSVNPSKHPGEVFDLYSIPAFDNGAPERAIGTSIKSNKQNVSHNDVLLSKIVPHIRRSWVVGPPAERRAIASGEWIVFRSTLVHPDYLRQVLVSDSFHSAFMKTVSGVGGSLLRARPAHVAKIKVPLPPLSEQRRIAAVLDQADTAREKRREAIAQLDEITQSIFLDMFGDPVVNPKGSPLKMLSEVGTLDRGVSKHRPRNAPELLGGAHPLIQTGDVANSNGYIREHHSSYSEIGLKQSKKWPAGTLCITIAANIAKTGILTFDACFPDSVVGFSADSHTVLFVQAWFSFLQKTLEEKAPESAQKNINLATLRSLPIPLPPMALQQEFARRVEAIERLKESHRAHLAELDALFASLQSRAFRGQL